MEKTNVMRILDQKKINQFSKSCYTIINIMNIFMEIQMQ